MSEDASLADSQETPRPPMNGATMWPMQNAYVVGDRVRGTVLLMLDGRVVEMGPIFARNLANEILLHVADVAHKHPGSATGGQS